MSTRVEDCTSTSTLQSFVASTAWCHTARPTGHTVARNIICPSQRHLPLVAALSDISLNRVCRLTFVKYSNNTLARLEIDSWCAHSDWSILLSCQLVRVVGLQVWQVIPIKNDDSMPLSEHAEVTARCAKIRPRDADNEIECATDGN